jgi:uncharacterized protein (DUF2236 family)
MISQTIHAERILLLGWGRALLLQFAHPAVAQGIVDHSEFLRDPRARWTRLRRTLDAMLTLTYGTPAQAGAVARGINGIHDRVHGRVRGAPYSAHDPALLGWVHATLVESFLLAYELYVAPLSAADKDRYCVETAGIESQLGIPAGQLPRSSSELRLYMQSMLDGPELTITEPARRLARELFRPVPRVMQPAMWLARLPAAGLLPPRLRAEYGFAWGPGSALALRVSAGTVRSALWLLPRSLRHWKAARDGSWIRYC